MMSKWACMVVAFFLHFFLAWWVGGWRGAQTISSGMYMQRTANLLRQLRRCDPRTAESDSTPGLGTDTGSNLPALGVEMLLAKVEAGPWPLHPKHVEQLSEYILMAIENEIFCHGSR